MATLVCKVMGAVFIVAAIWGFIDGHHVWIFHVNTAHNIVHLLSGIFAMVCGFIGPRRAKWFCIIFGVVYGLVAILGFLDVQRENELLHLNDADDWLHLGIALIFLVAGLSSKPSRPVAP